jgi:hypothetical protein
MTWSTVKNNEIMIKETNGNLYNLIQYCRRPAVLVNSWKWCSLLLLMYDVKQEISSALKTYQDFTFVDFWKWVEKSVETVMAFTV